jgi:hypothetical protein
MIFGILLPTPRCTEYFFFELSQEQPALSGNYDAPRLGKGHGS